MGEVLTLIKERHSARTPFDPKRPVARQDLRQIVEAARWSPTAHNMQNFEILIIDDKALLDRVGAIESHISEAFIRENYRQLSFSENELRQKKVGILGTMFPPTWTDPAKVDEAVRETSTLSQIIKGSPTVLIVVYDSRKRAPASEGDVLGMLSLGCVMENMWFMAQSLGISFQVMSVFGAEPVEEELKSLLDVPPYMKIGYACRLGYPIPPSARYLRVRRDVEDFTHYNRFGNKDAD